MLASHLDWFYLKIEPYSDKIALTYKGAQTSYGDLLQQIQMVEGFLSEGFSSPPRLMTRLSDSAATAVFLNAACHFGCVSPSNPKQTIFELQQLAEDTAPNAIVLEDAAPDVVEWAEHNNLGIILFKPHLNDFALEWLRPLSECLNEDDGTTLILQTSGSTGRPKSVPICAKALEISTANITKSLELNENDRVVHMLPMFHIGAILDLFLVPLSVGGSIQFVHPTSAENLIAAIQKPEVTWFQAVPTMLNALIDQLDKKSGISPSPNLRFVRSVSADLAPDLQQKLENLLQDVPVVQMYGMTETAGQIASNPPSLEKRKLGSVGTFPPETLIIMDRYGNSVEQGKTGEICVQGPTVTAGYLNTEKNDAFIGNWLKTGDLGYIDTDGYLHLQGRRKDIINRGGEKISAVEIEQCLYGLNQIQEAGVVSIPHPTLQEDIGCAIVLKKNQNLSSDEIRFHLQERLSDHKVPRKIEFLDQLPKLGSGKINKAEIIRLMTADTVSVPAIIFSKTEKKLAKIWKSALKKQTVKAEDDFFEQGGDSLMAQTFILEIEKAFNTRMPTNFLYEAPTFAKLAKVLESKTKSPQVTKSENDVHAAVWNLTASWPGSRKHENSLILSQNSSGQKEPFFFIAADQMNIADFPKTFGPDRPFHAMRTLSQQDCETEENMVLLASWYADEIQDLYPAGPIYIGGLCKGAHVALLVAEELIRRERAPALLLVIDYQMPRSYAGRGVVAWSKTTEHSAISNFYEPERGIPFLFPCGADSLRIDEEHGLCTHGKAAQQLVDFLVPLMTDKPFNPSEDLLTERQKAYKAGIGIKAPRFASPDETLNVKVAIQNKSSIEWEPTGQSNFRLLAKWKRLGGKVIDEVVAHSDLDQSVAPGETIVLTLPVTFPDRRSPMQLYVDMADEGVAWFNTASRRLIMRRYW